MSKFIKLTAEAVASAVADFEKYIRDFKMSDGKVSFTKDIASKNARAKLWFTPEAWVKTQLLVQSFDSEIAWHGICVRSEVPGEFLISDILVYPQTVTGATVTTDQKGYQDWLMSQPDEVFQNLRMQGHSHVNMGVSPSSVDINDEKATLSQLTDDMFYVFLIHNKRGDITVRIFDLRENTLYETADVDVGVVGVDMNGFLSSAKEAVRTAPVRPVTTQPASAAPASAWLPKKPAKEKPAEKRAVKKYPLSWADLDDDESPYGYSYYPGF